VRGCAWLDRRGTIDAHDPRGHPPVSLRLPCSRSRFDAMVLRLSPRLPGGPEHGDMGRLRFLRESDLGSHDGRCYVHTTHGQGREPRGSDAALRSHPRMGGVLGGRGPDPSSGRHVRGRAADAIRRSAWRAGDDVPPRSKRKRSRIQILPTSRARLHGLMLPRPLAA